MSAALPQQASDAHRIPCYQHYRFRARLSDACARHVAACQVSRVLSSTEKNTTAPFLQRNRNCPVLSGLCNKKTQLPSFKCPMQQKTQLPHIFYNKSVTRFMNSRFFKIYRRNSRQFPAVLNRFILPNHSMAYRRILAPIGRE